MKLYADTSPIRLRQMLCDLALLVLIWAAVRAGRVVRETVALLSEPGAALQRAGDQLSDAAGQGADTAGDLPAIGDALAQPFEWLSGSGGTLAEAGARQQEAVLSLATILGVVVTVLPILVLLALYLPSRLRWIREATAAQRFRGAGAQFFALRALAGRPLRDLRRVSADPWGDYEAGKFRVLANLELEALGLRGIGRG
jgi:hypothetical protein